MSHPAGSALVHRQHPLALWIQRHAGVLLQVIWAISLAVVLFLLVLGIPHHFARLRTGCTTGCIDWQLTPAGIGQLHGVGLTRDLYAGYLVALDVVEALIFFGVSALLISRARTNRMAGLSAIFLVLFRGGLYGTSIATLGLTVPVWRGPVLVLELLGQMSLIVYFYIFPDGRFVPPWTRLLALLGAAAQIPLWVISTSIVQPVSWDLIVYVLSLVSWAGLPVAQVYRYRKVSGPVERQQTKWVIAALFGVIIIALGIVLAHVLVTQSVAAPLGNWAGDTAWAVLGLLIPITIGVSVLRYRLWDVDVLINRTLVYGSLTITLGLVYILGVVGLQAAFRALTGQGSGLAVAISTLAIAALVQPLRRRIQAFIDRRFYRRKYDAARTLAAFGATLRDDVDFDQLTGDLLTVVQETMQPAHVSLWLRPGSRR